MRGIRTIVKALWIGATMTVPGVSGGTMAVITGIYEPLIHAVNGVRKDPKKHIGFLLQFVLAAGIGFFLFAGGVTWLLENKTTAEITRLLFCGIVTGGIPVLVVESKVQRIHISHVLWMCCGALLVFSISGITVRTAMQQAGMRAVLIQFAGGLLVAVALVLPGISVTHMLYLLGIYEWVCHRMYQLQFLALLPLVCGVLIGTFLSAGLIERMFQKFPTQVYMVIIGFVAASLVSLFPTQALATPVADLLAFAAGFAGMYALYQRK